jgi:predicted SnoaL-like aldol condensation-catalyzing enzyme
VDPTRATTCERAGVIHKALVLEAFDLLFNKRDYAAAEALWSENYIQHSALLAPGREGLFTRVRSLPSLRYENQFQWPADVR